MTYNPLSAKVTMSRRSLICSAALIAGVGGAQGVDAKVAVKESAEGNRQRQSYFNPVIKGMNPDPSVICVGDDYYAVTSSFEFFPGVPVYHSRDLINWRQIGYALDRATQFAAIGGSDAKSCSIFAATLRYHRGVFYMITTNARNFTNFYVTATNPAGPWSEPIIVDVGMFDPSLFFDEDGKVYYTRRGDPGIVQAEIDIATGKLTTPLRTISLGFLSNDTEGPHLYKFGKYYYLSLAEGGTRFLHFQAMGRSRSPWGPFETDPKGQWLSQHLEWWRPVKSTGHADIIQAHDGSWWTMYLATRHRTYDEYSLGRETFLAPLIWRNGWPVTNKAHIRDLKVEANTLPLHPWPRQPERDDFDASMLGLPWNFLGAAADGAARLDQRKGYLRLTGTPGRLEFSRPSAFVGRRQTEFGGTATAKLDFSPREGEEAGVAVFMAPDYFYAACLTRKDGKRCVALRKRVFDMETYQTSPIGEGEVEFRIVMADGRYRFEVRTVGAWQPLGEGRLNLIASEPAGVWTGMYLGMFAVSTYAEPSAADFDYFDYVAQG